MRKKQKNIYLFATVGILIFCGILGNLSYASSASPEKEDVVEIEENLPHKDFRFVTVEKVAGFFKADLTVYEEMNESSKAVGSGTEGGLCYILKQIGEWIYIESGEVRGFVKGIHVIQGEEANKQIEELATDDGRISIALDIDESGNITGDYFDTNHDTLFLLASPLVEPSENKNRIYTQTTTERVLIEKQHLLAKSAVNIMEYKDEVARVLGELPENGLAFCILEEGEWLYVESGNVRGFVKAQNFYGQDEFLQAKKPEEEYAKAKQLVEPANNKSLYYTFTSPKEGDPIRGVRESLVTYAQQLPEAKLGEMENAQAFMQSVYAKYGHTIPATREEQSNEGKVVAIGQVRAGDLVYWTHNGELSEPAMYVGSGMMIVFENEEKRVSLRDMKMSGSIWAIDFLSPQKEEYLGKFKLTAYCKCTQCSGVWSESPTASGVMPVEGRTVAMWGIPFGTSLLIDGEVYVVEDRGTPYGHIDIYMDKHESGLKFGVKYTDVSKIW